ncbi:Icd-like protein [Pectobacterium brasiliense]|uniref:host cell division inhibitor Icd-like protein n=1 Tax=Pectobacterium brasiliense TaxID=180957 RepID=UPI000CE69477|nr:host cell division inhibitor Icd-like protein [Pectobacterium brasiliense]PPE61941.1 Icd-like protein [Pectobacterium brasiliense]
MKDHTTHPQGRNNYTWRFLAVPKSYPNIRAIAVYITAPTEAEARSQMQGWVLYFSARLPAQEVHHV